MAGFYGHTVFGFHCLLNGHGQWLPLASLQQSATPGVWKPVGKAGLGVQAEVESKMVPPVLAVLCTESRHG